MLHHASDVRRTPIQFRLNGDMVEADIEPRALLADFLREKCGLSGTKVSCDMQVCGVCTVLVDSLPVSSCTYLAIDADGRCIETIDGLGSAGALHPIQQAFVDSYALQCGYCTPGFIMMTLALLRDDPSPDRTSIIAWLEGNICRCTGYLPIVEAVLQAAAAMSEEGSNGV